MEATKAVTRVDVLAEAARRLREHYKNRLTALYALPEDPYEPTPDDEDFAIHLVIILREPFDFLVENEQTTNIIDPINHENAGHFVLFDRVCGLGDELALHAREEGVLL